MAYLHRGARLAWLAHARTASQATATALVEQAGFESVSEDGEQRGGACRGWHHDGLPELGWEPVSIATTVRHHMDAIASWYEYHRSLDFGELCRDGLHTAAKVYWPDPHRLWALHGDVADTLLRYESLERDLNRWLTGHGLEPVELPVLNASEGRLHDHWRDYYGPEDMAAVEGRYGDEMRDLGYGVKRGRVGVMS